MKLAWFGELPIKIIKKPQKNVKKQRKSGIVVVTNFFGGLKSGIIGLTKGHVKK